MAKRIASLPPKRVGRGTIPVDVFKQRYLELEERGEISSWSLAQHLGWKRRLSGRIIPDCSRVKRTLGLRTYNSGAIRATINVETARRLADRLGIDPLDAGF